MKRLPSNPRLLEFFVPRTGITVTRGDRNAAAQRFRHRRNKASCVALLCRLAQAQTLVTLSHESNPRGLKVRLAVKDQGDGIEAFHLPRLAERFYRIDGHRSREKGGTGLGLAIVKHIAHRHRGRLVIDSAPGQGSTFAVLLPVN